MPYVEQMNVEPRMTVGQLVLEMGRSGVLGAGRLASATSIITDMFKDPSYEVVLTTAGPMIPGGLRKIIGALIRAGYIDIVIASGANIVHDIIEALGYRGQQGSFYTNDVTLRAEGIGRAGDIFFDQEGFEALEKMLHALFPSLASSRDCCSVSELMAEIGKRLTDPHSMLQIASKHDVPVFSPGILDSMMGLHLWTYNQLKTFRIDTLKDMDHLANRMYAADKVGVIILGGGLPKHFALGASMLREGVDAAVQITLDRPEGGSFSGAPLEESISWKKVQVTNQLASIIGDGTIVFPLIIAAVLERLQPNT